MSAWKLSWDVLCDSFHGQIEFASATVDTCSAASDIPTFFQFSSRKVVPAYENSTDVLRSCINKDKFVSQSQVRSKSVRFQDQISVHIGLDDEIQIYSNGKHKIDISDLANETEKPWTKPRPKPKNIVECRANDAYYDGPSSWHGDTNPQEEDDDDDDDDSADEGFLCMRHPNHLNIYMIHYLLKV